MDAPKLNLIQKLAAVGMEINAVEKHGENKDKQGKVNYKYVKAADVAKEIRHKLFARNIILTIDEKELTTVGSVKTYSGGELPLVCVKAEFTFHDGDSEEKLTQCAFGIAMDSGDKAIYKAKTGALKYVLRGIALIPDEKDDPEHDVDPEQVNDKITDAERRFEATEAEGRISDFRVSQFWNNAKKNGRTTQQISTFLGDLGNYVQVEHVLNRDWEKAIAWASNPLASVPKTAQEAVAQLQRSVDMAKAQKAVKTAGKCQECGGKMWPSKFKEGDFYCGNKECPTRQKGYKKPNGTEVTEASPVTDEDIPF